MSKVRNKTIPVPYQGGGYTVIKSSTKLNTITAITNALMEVDMVL